MLAQALSEHGMSTKSLTNLKEIQGYLLNNTQSNDVILVLGAGDIYQVAENIVA